MKTNITRLVLPALLACSASAYAQDILVVNPEYKKVSGYEFNQEWHYLSSELYLFNGSKFQQVVNDIYASIPKKKKTDISIIPENILISAKIDGTALGNLSYPIFNFNIESVNGQLKTFTSDNYEAIRIMDNLPLSSVSGKVDCHINIDLITHDHPNQVYEFVAAQLGQISSWATTPLSAAKTLVGELGNLITSRSAKKEYKFSSTIRLYEDDDFSKRVASISVYSFIPSQVQSANLDTADISKYLDSFDNPKIDRTKLMQLLGKCDYPFMAIVNYKSKYVSDPVIGDETTSETVDARMQKVRKSYESGLLSSEIYTQEIKLVEYLRAFVNLKSSINSYILNYKNRVTDDFGVQYQQIFDNYMAQRRMYQSRISEFGSKPIFRNEFLPTYQSILTNSEVYLDGDMNLKNIKNIVKILLENGDGAAPASKFDAARNEQTLQILHSVEFPSDHKGVASLDNLDMMIAGLEAAQYKNVFQHKAQRLKGMRPSAEATAFCDKLQNEVNSSYCMSCRQQVSPIINDYMQRLDTENMRLAQQKLSSSVAAAKDRVFTILQKEQVLQKHFKNDYGDTLPPDVEYIYEDFQKLQSAREKLQAVIKKDYSDQNSTQINILADNIDYESQDLAKILEHICSKMPELCE